MPTIKDIISWGYGLYIVYSIHKNFNRNLEGLNMINRLDQTEKYIKHYKEFRSLRKQENKAMISVFRRHAFMMFVIGLALGFIFGKMI